MQIENKAQKILKQFCDYYQKRDLTSLLRLFTTNTILWGTGIDEVRVGLEQVEIQLRRDWQQSEKSAIEIVSFVTTPHDSIWTAAICAGRITVEGKEHLFENLRGTIILAFEDGIWKISHMHASFPDFRNPDNNSFPLKV